MLPRHALQTLRPQLRAAALTTDGENMVHSSSMSPTSPGIWSKFSRRWELNTSLAEGSARRFLQTLNIRLGLPSLSSFHLFQQIQLTTIWWCWSSQVCWVTAGSFLSSPSPEPSHKRTLSTLQRKPPHIELVSLFRAHTEQHQVNSLRIYLLKTWILSLIPPGNLTTITHSLVNHHPTPRPKETTDPWSAEVSFFAPDSTLKMKGKRTAEDRRQV
ncbi:hypothetical protein ATANTOWER_014825 [Ataeniobius toweri]|uniref:Uncharacterized protein n=1 Tax=Ataeniobius toweri TaxID=208326 RepID=A0ABU7BVF8_9TELE|nr:hypothetical protein [Ataeniobius toweri]